MTKTLFSNIPKKDQEYFWLSYYRSAQFQKDLQKFCNCVDLVEQIDSCFYNWLT